MGWKMCAKITRRQKNKIREKTKKKEVTKPTKN